MNLHQLALSLSLCLHVSLSAQAAPQQSSPAQEEDTQAIRATLTDYIEGSTQGQPDRLRTAFLPDSNLYSVRDGKISVWSSRDYIRDTKQGQPTGESGKIISIDFENDAAIAKVEVSNPNSRLVYVDYFMLLKVKDKWTIVHKLFTTKQTAEENRRPGSADSAAEATTTESRSASADLSAGVDEVVEQILTNHHVPGAAVVIVQGGKTIFERGYGVSNVEQMTKVDPDETIFRIGSISKALTLLTLTRQIELGRLGMNDDVATHFSGIENPHQFAQPVTIKNLLMHTSGFDQIGRRDRQVRAFELPLAERQSRRPSISQYLRDGNLRRVTRPGLYFRYDTYGSTLAGALIESATNLPYAEAMQQELFELLGMTKTFVETDENNFPALATGYGFDQGEFVPQPYEVYVTTPASSVDATPADMALLLEALTGDGANRHGRFLQPDAVKRVLAPQFRPHPEFPGITHGFFETFSSDNDAFKHHVRQIWHGGSMRGFFSAMVLVPDYQLGIFVVTNRAPESGGGNVPIGLVVDRVISNLPNVPQRELYAVPERNEAQDLSEYVGDYYYGVFCHECSADDLANGAWQRGAPRTVGQEQGALTLGSEIYLPCGDDVFVRSDGAQRVFFGRSEAGEVAFFVFSTSPDTFERILN